MTPTIPPDPTMDPAAILSSTLPNDVALAELRARRAMLQASLALPAAPRERGVQLFTRAIEEEAPRALGNGVPVVHVLRVTMVAVGRLALEAGWSLDEGPLHDALRTHHQGQGERRRRRRRGGGGGNKLGRAPLRAASEREKKTSPARATSTAASKPPRAHTAWATSSPQHAPPKRSLIVKLSVRVPRSLLPVPSPSPSRHPSTSSSLSPLSTPPSTDKDAPPHPFPPFPPLPARALSHFTKGVVTAIENIAEDHSDSPAATLLELVDQLAATQPLIDDGERAFTMRGADYVYESVRVLWTERSGRIGIERLCREFKAHVAREHDFGRESAV